MALTILIYNCQNESIALQVLQVLHSITTSLLLADPSKIFPLYIEVKAGKNVEITCKASNILWWKFYNDQPSGITFQSNKLYIKNATEQHQVIYVCHGIDENMKHFFGVSIVLVLRKYLCYGQCECN